MAIKSFNIIVCASGGGGNFRSLAKHQFDCGYRISLLVVDRECFAIDVAKEYGIPYTVLYRKFLNKSFFEEFEKVIPVDTSLIVLAGFFPIPADGLLQKAASGFVKSGSVESSIFILHYCQNMEERVCME
mgnify:CR=1 FL=1